jgi:hypothetical protein
VLPFTLFLRDKVIISLFHIGYVEENRASYPVKRTESLSNQSVIASIEGNKV